MVLQVSRLTLFIPTSSCLSSNPFISQDTLESQERKRLEALRQRDQDRARRFVDAKNRSIGIDKSYLDKQVEEKRLREVEEKEEKLKEGTFRSYG
jgi:predicted RecB family nuclease